MKSVRGASGGYYLARAPEDITLKNVVEAVEGDLQMIDVKLEDRTLQAVWNELQADFIGLLAATDVQSLINGKLRENEIPDFQI